MTGIEIGEFYASFINVIINAASKEKVKLSLINLEDKLPSVSKIAEKIEKVPTNGLINTPRSSRNQYQQLKELLPENFPVISY